MLEQPGFGRRLRQLRQQRGLSQVDLAGAGMSAAYLSRLESGGRPPTEKAVAYLAERLGVTADMLDQAQPEDSLGEVVAIVAAMPDRDLDSDIGEMITQSLESASDASDMTRWHALVQLARVHERLGDFRRKREVLSDLNELSEQLGRAALLGRARLRLAFCERDLGNMEAARDAVTDVVKGESNMRVSAADSVRARLLLVSCQAELGDLAEASRLVDQICRSQEGSSGPLAAQAFWSAATVAARQGNAPRAAEWLAQAVTALDSRDDLTLWTRLRLAGASLSLAADPPRLDKAEDFLAQADSALTLIGTPRHHVEAVFLKAKLAFHHNDLAHTTALLAAGENDKSLLSYRDQVRFDVLRNLVALRAGDRDVLKDLREIASQVQAANMPDLAAEVWRTVAESSI